VGKVLFSYRREGGGGVWFLTCRFETESQGKEIIQVGGKQNSFLQKGKVRRGLARGRKDPLSKKKGGETGAKGEGGNGIYRKGGSFFFHLPNEKGPPKLITRNREGGKGDLIFGIPITTGKGGGTPGKRSISL